MVLYYPFSGNANDSSGNGYNGTVSGATLTTDRFGAANGAYSFDGSTSTIRCGDILDSVFSAPVAKFSVSGWADTRTYGSFQTGGGFIIGKNAGGTYGPYQWSVSHVGGLIVAGVFSDTAQQNYVETGVSDGHESMVPFCVSLRWKPARDAACQTLRQRTVVEHYGVSASGNIRHDNDE